MTRAETWDRVNQTFKFPGTPIRLVLYVLPPNSTSNRLPITDLSVECYHEPSIHGLLDSSYVYNDTFGEKSSVLFSNKSTVLTGPLGTGPDLAASDSTKPANSAVGLQANRHAGTWFCMGLSVFSAFCLLIKYLFS